MKVNCLWCGHGFGLSDAYDNYAGMVRCPTCGGLLSIQSEDAELRSVTPTTLQDISPPAPRATVEAAPGPSAEL